MARRARRHHRGPTDRSGAHTVPAASARPGSGQDHRTPASRQPLGAWRRADPVPLRRRSAGTAGHQRRPSTTHRRRRRATDVPAHHRIGTGLAGRYLSKAGSIHARFSRSAQLRLTQQPPSTGIIAWQHRSRCRVVHGGGRASHATNARPTRWATRVRCSGRPGKRPQIVRKNRTFNVEPAKGGSLERRAQRCPRPPRVLAGVGHGGRLTLSPTAVNANCAPSGILVLT